MTRRRAWGTLILLAPLWTPLLVAFFMGAVIARSMGWLIDLFDDAVDAIRG